MRAALGYISTRLELPVRVLSVRAIFSGGAKEPPDHIVPFHDILIFYDILMIPSCLSETYFKSVIELPSMPFEATRIMSGDMPPGLQGESGQNCRGVYGHRRSPGR